LCIAYICLWFVRLQFVVKTVTDGVSSSNDSMQTCCKQQHSAAVNSDYERNVVHADGVASMTDAGTANDFELLGETQRQEHTQPDRTDSDFLSSGTSVKLQEYSDQTAVSWQRIRSLIMVVLGLVVRLSFSSVFLSRFMQVTSLTYCICWFRLC